MAENTTKDDFDDDFNFEAESQNFAGSDLELAAPAQRKVSKGPLIIGGIVVVFVVWKLWGFFGPSKPKAASADRVVLQKTETPAAQAGQADVKASDDLVPGLPLNVTNDSSDPKLKESIAKLEQVTHESNERIKNLEESLKQMAINLNGYQQAVSGIDQSIKGLSSSVNDISKNMNAPPAPPPPMMEPPPVMQPPSPTVGGMGAPGESTAVSAEMANPSVTIHAIIPGRVWLKNREGKTVTAVEGDDVESYGKIVSIDAPNGVVITSSGMTLR